MSARWLAVVMGSTSTSKRRRFSSLRLRFFRLVRPKRLGIWTETIVQMVNLINSKVWFMHRSMNLINFEYSLTRIWMFAVIAKLVADHIFNSKENIDENLISLENDNEVSWNVLPHLLCICSTLNTVTLRPTWFNSFELQSSTVNFQKIISRFPEVSVHVEVLMIWSDLASVIFQYSFDRLAWHCWNMCPMLWTASINLQEFA